MTETHLVDFSPIPEGVVPFKTTNLDGVEISFYQFGSVLVAMSEPDCLVRLEIVSVVLHGEELSANLLGFGMTDGGQAYCSLYVPYDLYRGYSRCDLDISLLAVEPDAE